MISESPRGPHLESTSRKMQSWNVCLHRWCPKVAPGLLEPRKSTENGTQNPGLFNAIKYMFELVISTKQKSNNGIQCAAQFRFWQGKGCYGPMGVQKASNKAIKKGANIHSKLSIKQSTTDQPMLTYNMLACLWRVHGLDVL